MKNLSALLTGRKGAARNGRKYYCINCLSDKNSTEAQKEHKKLCWRKGTISCPKEGTKMMFNSYNNKWRVPFVIYADFEAMQESPENACCKY